MHRNDENIPINDFFNYVRRLQKVLATCWLKFFSFLSKTTVYVPTYSCCMHCWLPPLRMKDMKHKNQRFFVLFMRTGRALRCDVEFQITECKVVERHIVENQVVEQTFCRTYKSQKLQIVELINYHLRRLSNW
jgi:hypothetical protein